MYIACLSILLDASIGKPSLNRAYGKQNVEGRIFSTDYILLSKGGVHKTRSQSELPMVRMKLSERRVEVRTHQSRNTGG